MEQVGNAFISDFHALEKASESPAILGSSFSNNTVCVELSTASYTTALHLALLANQHTEGERIWNKMEAKKILTVDAYIAKMRHACKLRRPFLTIHRIYHDMLKKFSSEEVSSEQSLYPIMLLALVKEGELKHAVRLLKVMNDLGFYGRMPRMGVEAILLLSAEQHINGKNQNATILLSSMKATLCEWGVKMTEEVYAFILTLLVSHSRGKECYEVCMNLALEIQGIPEIVLGCTAYAGLISSARWSSEPIKISQAIFEDARARRVDGVALYDAVLGVLLYVVDGGEKGRGRDGPHRREAVLAAAAVHRALVQRSLLHSRRIFVLLAKIYLNAGKPGRVLLLWQETRNEGHIRPLPNGFPQLPDTFFRTVLEAALKTQNQTIASEVATILKTSEATRKNGKMNSL